MIREIKRNVLSGYLMIVVLAVVQLGLVYVVIQAIQAQSIAIVVSAGIASIIVLVCWGGLFMVHPNEAKVLQLFGKYVGTTHHP